MKSRIFGLSALAAALLAGCGGVDTLTVTGVAAEGPALASATVSVTCKSGTQRDSVVTSNADGSYTVKVLDGEGPCVVTAKKGSATYQAFTAGSGSTLTVNVTPVSTVVAQVLLSKYGAAGATDLTTLLSNSTVVSVLTGSSTNYAQTVRNALLASANAGNTAAGALYNGFSTSEMATLLAGNFKVGDSIDQKLDTVVTTAGLVDSTTGAINTTVTSGLVTSVATNLNPAVTTGSTGTGTGTGSGS